MTVEVRLPALFADRIDGLTGVTVTASTVEDALHKVAERHPELRTLIVSRDGAINPLMVVFLNNEQLSADTLSSQIRDGDEIEIVPAIEGGTLGP